MIIDLKGKKALVGGGTSGLGKAIAWQLADSGAQVTIMARNREKLEECYKELPHRHGQNHDYLEVDFLDYEDFQDRLTAYFDHKTIDILVNNTNGPKGGSALEKNIEDYQQAFDLLFKTYCLTSLLAVEGMKKKQFGRIINVSSMSVKEPIQNLVLSNSIRAAVINWAKTISRELAPFGITVNNILTGSFDTERLRDLHSQQANKQGVPLEEWRKKMADEIPLKRFGKPEEYGYLATFLASEQAAYLTGINLPIDGGAIRSV